MVSPRSAGFGKQASCYRKIRDCAPPSGSPNNPRQFSSCLTKSKYSFSICQRVEQSPPEAAESASIWHTHASSRRKLHDSRAFPAGPPRRSWCDTARREMGMLDLNPRVGGLELGDQARPSPPPVPRRNTASIRSRPLVRGEQTGPADEIPSGGSSRRKGACGSTAGFVSPVILVSLVMRLDNLRRGDCAVNQSDAWTGG